MNRAANAEAIAIEAIGLSRTFDDLVAVDGIDLTVERGELFSLLGPNGAGKTTTIKMLCCLLRPTSGSASIMGHDIAMDSLSVKRAIAVVPQETAIAEHLNAWENLSLMARLHGTGKSQTRQKSGALLEMMALAGRADEKVKKYSGGMKRRLSIAMALVSEPQVLFLDEPTIGLDPQARRGMWEHIAGLKGDTTVMLTTHYLEEADALADRIAVVDTGKVIASGSPDELKAGMSAGPVTVIEARGLTADAITAIKEIYPNVEATDRGLEIQADEVDLYDIQDVLRPRGITVEATYRKRTTLDDVFLELTGKQMRE
jgi:ABC-2 type transport system ATP-binding protein